MPDDPQQQAQQSQYTVADTSLHTHDSVNSPSLDFTNMSGRTRYVAYRIVSSSDAVVVANVVGGYFSFPFSGGFSNSVGGNLSSPETPNGNIVAFATVDSAGASGNTIVDVKISTPSGSTRTSIFASGIKLVVLSGANSSLQTVQQPSVAFGFNETSFGVGDRLSFDVTSVSSSAPIGLTVYLRVTETSQ